MLNDAINKERVALEKRIAELGWETDRLLDELKYFDRQIEVVEGYLEQVEVTRSFLEVRLEDLDREAEAREARAEAFERELDRGAYGASAARERSEVAYGRLWHGDCAWHRAAKKAARGCDASKKKYRKKTRERCRKAARAERALQRAELAIFLTDDDE